MVSEYFDRSDFNSHFYKCVFTWTFVAYDLCNLYARPTPSLLVDVDATIFASVICPQLFSTTSLACYFNPQYLTLYRRETQ
jgi:hypothetical protein